MDGQQIITRNMANIDKVGLYDGRSGKLITECSWSGSRGGRVSVQFTEEQFRKIGEIYPELKEEVDNFLDYQKKLVGQHAEKMNLGIMSFMFFYFSDYSGTELGNNLDWKEWGKYPKLSEFFDIVRCVAKGNVRWGFIPDFLKHLEGYRSELQQ